MEVTALRGIEGLYVYDILLQMRRTRCDRKTRAYVETRIKKSTTREGDMDNTSPERGLIRCSMLIRVNRERRLRIVIPLVVTVKEPTQPDNLIAEIEHNDLHIDLEVVLE